jgi:hypothetical protein
VLSLTAQLEPVVCLVGRILPAALTDSASDVQVLIRSGVVRDYPEPFRAALEYLSTPRLESDARAWLAAAGAPAGAVGELVANGHLLAIPPSSPIRALRAFTGVRVVPTGHVLTVPGDSDGLVFIGRTPQDSIQGAVSALLADALWKSGTQTDLPHFALRSNKVLGLTDDVLAARALFGLSELLEKRLAYLTWLEDPRAKVSLRRMLSTRLRANRRLL